MSARWLDVIGIGEDGLDGLSNTARAVLEEADVIIGGDRHHGLAEDFQARRITWPSPFRAMVEEIRALEGRRVAVLVTGDPLWFSAGGHLSRMFPDQITFHPQLSAFQWAAARMGWSLADVEPLTIHGRPAEQITPFFAHGMRAFILTQDASSPATVAGLLSGAGYGASRLTVLGALGGPRETRIDGVAASWEAEAPEFHTMAIEVLADAEGPTQLPVTGLPDTAFQHDGKMTKREVRALTIAALAPRRGEVLWDVGAGCGSVGIEWMRAGRDAQAYGIEPHHGRRAMAEANATALGVPRLKLIDGTAPEAFPDLPDPDAVFLGGGLSDAAMEGALTRLRLRGRLVANAVTLESEALLQAWHKSHGGTLVRLQVSRAEPVGGFWGWRPAMPVTQWVLNT